MLHDGPRTVRRPRGVDVPPISVIIPAYNASDTIEQCVISLLDQSIGRPDIIVVDDESTDDTTAVLESYVRDGRCVVQTIEHAGPGAASNAGLAVADSEYVTFLGADDVLLPQACEHLLRVAEGTSADVVYGPHLRYNWQGIPEPVLYLSWALQTDEDQNLREQENLATGFPVVAGKLFRTSLIRESALMFAYLFTAEDYVFSIQAWAAAERVHACSIPVYLRRPFTDTLGISDRPATFPLIRDHMRAIEIVDQFCAEHGYAEIRASNCQLGTGRGLRMAATVIDPAERAQALQVVLEYTDTLLGDKQASRDVLGIERDELARMDPLALTPARVRYWQVKASLTAILHDAQDAE